MKVFVSYSRKDEEFVQRLAADLEQRGIDAWIDTQDIANTDEDSWRAAITDAIDASAALLLVLSPDSVLSEPVSKEVMVAADAKRRIVPVVTRGPVDLPSGLRFQLAG